MITKEQIEMRKQQCVEQRAALVEQANRQIAMLDGAIAALDALLTEPPPDTGMTEEPAAAE